MLGLHALQQVLLFAAVTAGWALAPDLDHPGAAVSRWGGWVTEWLSLGLRRLSAAVFTATRSRRDQDSEGTHRHLSHTLLFAVAVGAAAAVATAVAPRWAVLIPVAVGALLAARVLGNWVLFVGCVPVAWGLLTGVDSLSPVQGWIGIAVGLGCLVHVLGDAITKAGVPILWPVQVHGQRWYRIGSPRWLRFAAGGRFERRWVFHGFAALGVLLVPGVLPVVVSSVSALA